MVHLGHQLTFDTQKSNLTKREVNYFETGSFTFTFTFSMKEF